MTHMAEAQTQRMNCDNGTGVNISRAPSETDSIFEKATRRMGEIGNIHKEITIPNRVFVKGFHCSTTEEELAAAFQKYGTIIETKIIWKPRTAQRYAFITFDSQYVAENLITNYKTVYLHGAELTVAPAKIRRDRTPSSRERFHVNGGVGGDVEVLTPPQSPLSPAARLVPVPYTVSPDGLFMFHQPMGCPPVCVPIAPAALQQLHGGGGIDGEGASDKSESPIPSTPERNNTQSASSKQHTPNHHETTPSRCCYETKDIIMNSPRTPSSTPSPPAAGGAYYKTPPQPTNTFGRTFPLHLPGFGRGQHHRPTFQPLANQQQPLNHVTTTGIHMPNIHHPIAYGNHPLNAILNGNMAYQCIPVATLVPPTTAPVLRQPEWTPTPPPPPQPRQNYMNSGPNSGGPEGKKVTFSIPSTSSAASAHSNRTAGGGGSVGNFSGGFRMNGVPQPLNRFNLKNQPHYFMPTGAGKVKRVIVQQ